MANISEEYRLDAAAVDEIADKIQRYLETNKAARRDALRFRLAMEEVLLRIWEHAGDAPIVVTLSMGKRFGRQTIALRWAGEPFNPTGTGGNEDDWSSRILENLGVAPAWSSRRGVNIVQLRPPKAEGGSRLLLIAAAIVAAVALGLLGMLLPADLRETVDRVLLTPVFDAFLGLLSTLAGGLVFLTVASGVFGIGDTSSLNTIGKTMFSRFIGSAFLVSAFALLVTRPFLRLETAPSPRGESQIEKVSELLFNIFPKNPVQPFLDGNTLQIIVLAIFIGVVLLILGDRARNVRTVIEECGSVAQMMMEQVCRLIPAFVFVSLLRQVWYGFAARLLSLWKPLGLYLLVNALMVVILLAIVSAQTKTPPLLLLRKTVPAALIAFSTASSMAAYSASKDAFVKKLGIQQRLFDFGFPIGIVLYMPAGVVSFVVLAGWFAEIYGVQVNPSWFIMALLLSAILSIAIPPVPGAMLTCYGILVAQLNIPAESVALAVALDVIMDYFSSGLDVLAIELEMTSQASRLHMLDRDILHKP